jgi:hypothetical protein
MTDLAPELTALGGALERAVAADLSISASARRRERRTLALAVAVVAVAVPGLAYSASRLIGGGEVAASMPAGTLALAGTEPTCTVVTQGVEYHCVLAHPPAPEVSDWMGTAEPTVDATKHVNGGCRSLRSDGLEWECYLGRAAVDQRIVGPGFLGQYAPSPGVG